MQQQTSESGGEPGGFLFFFSFFFLVRWHFLSSLHLPDPVKAASCFSADGRFPAKCLWVTLKLFPTFPTPSSVEGSPSGSHWLSDWLSWVFLGLWLTCHWGHQLNFMHSRRSLVFPLRSYCRGRDGSMSKVLGTHMWGRKCVPQHYPHTLRKYTGQGACALIPLGRQSRVNLSRSLPA